MGAYPLLTQRRISRRMRWKLVLLAVLLLALGLYDQVTAILGPNWIWIWLALLATALMWFYYAVLMRRTAIHVAPAFVRLQGPLTSCKISYGRIQLVTPGKLDQHYSYKSLSLGERPALKPLFHRTCAFVELNSYPKAFKWRRLWFPRTLFGTSKKGLLCHVDDWMAFSQDLESVRARYQARQSNARNRPQMTLAGRILAEDVEFL